MPTVVLHIQVQILSPRLRYLGRQTHCAGSGSEDVQVAHLLPAVVQHQEGQGELSLSVSRQAFGGIQRQRRKKTHKTKTKIHTHFPTDKVFQESCPVPGAFHSLP